MLFLFGCAQKTEDDPPKESEETRQENISSTITTTASTTKAAPVYEYEELELTAYRGDNTIYGIKYAVALAEKGYNVYTFDFCGGSEDSESDGSDWEAASYVNPYQEFILECLDGWNTM